MQIDDSIPRYDLPVDFLVDDNISGNILQLYKSYPSKIKAVIFAMCIDGEVNVTINLSDYIVKKNDFIIVMPGSFFQIHEISNDTRAAFIGFSSSFINNANFWKSITNNLGVAFSHPITPLKEERVVFFKNFFSFLTNTANTNFELLTRETLLSIMDIFYNTLSIIYKEYYRNDDGKKPREYIVLAEFLKLAFENYQTEHKASFYAREVGLTLSHFCATIKKATGKTVQEILRDLLIMDAKAQLKNSDARINKIAKSLGFSPTAFNRYFLEYVNMTPLEYRNS